MADSAAHSKGKPEQPADETPEQKLGDTPVPPWAMPTPEQKAEAAPIRETLAAALSEVDSQEKADAIVEALTEEIGQTKAAEVAATQPPPRSPAEAAQEVQAAAEAAPDGEKVKTALAETARVLTTPDQSTREVVAQAAQEIFDPEQQGAPTVADPQQREYLRRALIKRLKPLDAADAELFLVVNHLPHTRLLNSIFYTITLVYTGGTAWYVLMAALALVRPRFGWRVARDSVVPLALATSLVEHPIKRYFRRRRPFISIVQAIVIGRKPGSWSFPSGHSAGAFAGAWLLSRHLPRQRGLLYLLASLVAFSRIYLGSHYPGDVVTGSALGAFFAWLLRRLFDWVLGRRTAENLRKDAKAAKKSQNRRK